MLRTAEEYFLAVAQAGSFSRAAEELYVSQPAVSKQISQYEAELGFPLFYRSTRTVVLTPQGNLIYQALKKMSADWNAVLRKAQMMQLSPKGVLHVGMLYGWSLHRLPTQALQNFQLHFPGIEIVIEKHDYVALTELLRSGQLDVILTASDELTGAEDITCIDAYQDALVMLLHADHPLAREKDVFHHLSSLNAYVMGKYSSNCTEDTIRSKFNLNAIYTRPNLESILLAVDQKKGCAFTALSSSVCESKEYICYDTGLVLNVVCAWLSQNHDPLLPLLVNEFRREPT